MVFRDSGCGISPENQQKLFMNFGKLNETQKANPAGVGLGLSICREIIIALGGEVQITSEEGKGTDFIIRLESQCYIDEAKLAQAKQQIEERGYLSESSDSGLIDVGSFLSYDDEEEGESEEIELEETDSDPSSEKKLTKITEGGDDDHFEDESPVMQQKLQFDSFDRARTSVCLLANDNQFLLYGFQLGLSPHFTSVETVENGQEAVDAVESHTKDYYSAIVLDISMPIMDGMEACVLIKEYLSGKGPFVYALTSECDLETIKRMKQSGFKAIF